MFGCPSVYHGEALAIVKLYGMVVTIECGFFCRWLSAAAAILDFRKLANLTQTVDINLYQVYAAAILDFFLNLNF